MVFLCLFSVSSWSLENGRYYIQSSLSNLYLDVARRSLDDGADIIQYPLKNGENQQYDITDLGDGTYSIRPAHSGKSLDVYAWNANDGAEVRQWTYHGMNNQRWHIDSVGSNLYSITSVFSGKAIEVSNMNTAIGGDISLSSYSGESSQKWSFTSVYTDVSVDSSSMNVFIAGDSIVMTYDDTSSDSDMAGWGQMLHKQYNSNVNINNKAIGGRTARRFIDEGRLDAIWNAATAGDYLLVQFGTNDGHKTATYTINGETIPYYLDPQTDFKYYLSQYIQGARSRNINLVFVTPTPRNSAYCTGGNGTSAYAQAMRELAEEEGVPVADLNQKTVNYLMAICPAPTPEDFFFVRDDGTVDGTHFQENGARILARFVADGIAEASLELNNYRR
jgi:lysophospholipase L1-like esterase